MTQNTLRAINPSSCYLVPTHCSELFYRWLYEYNYVVCSTLKHSHSPLMRNAETIQPAASSTGSCVSCQLLEMVQQEENSTCKLRLEIGYKNRIQHTELQFTSTNVTQEHESSVLDAYYHFLIRNSRFNCLRNQEVFEYCSSEMYCNIQL